MNAYDIWGCGPVAFNPESEPIWLKGVQDSRGSSILWSSELTEFEKKAKSVSTASHPAYSVNSRWHGDLGPVWLKPGQVQFFICVAIWTDKNNRTQMHSSSLWLRGKQNQKQTNLFLSIHVILQPCCRLH